MLASVRFRLTLWYVAILGLVLLIFSGLVYLVLSNSLHSGLDDLLRNRAVQLTATYNISDGQLNLQEQDESGPLLPTNGELLLLINSGGSAVQKAGRLTDVAVTDLLKLVSSDKSNAEILFNYKLTLPAPTNPKTGSSSPQQVDYRVLVAPIEENGVRVGTLVLGRSREEVEATLHSLLLVLLIAAPAALLITAGGGYWLATRAMSPVRAISRTAHKIGETDLSRRLNIETRDELGEMAATFDQMLDRLEGAFERQRQFTADASHELRTPLTIINLEVEQALASKNYTKEEYREALQVVKSEGSQMNRLVNDLLTLARADAGQNILKLETLDLGYLVLEVAERLVPLAQQNGLKLQAAELPELEVRGDYRYLAQMLTNLVENAIKYSSGIGDCILLEVGSSATSPYNSEPDWAWIRVSDNGPGIEAEYLPFLFDRFYRVDAARTHIQAGQEHLNDENPNGSGLGLAIVKWIVAAHGGKVTVQSRTGTNSGAVFEVWLPFVAV